MTNAPGQRKRRERNRLAAIRIPDFSERGQYTLEEILQDESIPQLQWEQVEIGKAIGKGACGLVSQGTWTPNKYVLGLLWC